MMHRLFVIESNYSELTNVIEYLQYRGYHISVVKSTENLIENVISDNPDLVILDVLRENSLENITIIREIKNDSRTSHTPILGFFESMNYYKRFQDIKLYLEYDDFYIGLPIVWPKLIAKIENLIK